MLAMKAELQKRGHELVDPVLERCDIVVALADSPLCMLSSAAGKQLLLLSLYQSQATAISPHS